MLHKPSGHKMNLRDHEVINKGRTELLDMQLRLLFKQYLDAAIK